MKDLKTSFFLNETQFFLDMEFKAIDPSISRKNTFTTHRFQKSSLLKTQNTKPYFFADAIYGVSSSKRGYAPATNNAYFAG